MLKFNNFLVENQEINLSMKIYKTLSWEAQEAIDMYEASNWHTGPLAKAFKEKNAIFHEIYDAAKPIRDYLKKKNGSHITLYRGFYARNGKADPYPDRVLTSWSSDKRVAGHFAGLNKYKYTNRKEKDGNWNSYDHTIETDTDIKQTIDNFEKRGYANNKRFHYIISKEDPKYYNIYYKKSRNFVTDGYTKDFAKDRWEDAKDAKEFNDEGRKDRYVIEKKIPVDDILWITNNLGSKEYIVFHR